MVLSIHERIAASKKATAVERAWKVAKTLEGERTQIRELTWVEPIVDEKRGITRPIDFDEEFPGGVSPLSPINLAVIAPANILVPGENLNVNWTMPLLKRSSVAEALPPEVRTMVGGASKTRPIIDVVSFLPFPRNGAPPEESFSPEFLVTMEISNKMLGDSKNLFFAIARYGGKLIPQFVNTDTPGSLCISADPAHQTLFKAEMLVNLGAEDLASTPSNAGVLDIFILRLCESYMAKIAKSITIGSRMNDIAPTREMYKMDYTPPVQRDDTPFADLRRQKRHLASIPGGAQAQSLPAPERTAKEVGDVRLSDGTAGERIETRRVEDYEPDRGFAAQQVRIRFLGVREGPRAEEQARNALDNMA